MGLFREKTNKKNKGKRKTRRKKWKVNTSEKGLSRLSDAIQVFAFGVLVWAGVTLFNLAFVGVYYLSLFGLITGLITIFYRPHSRSEKQKDLLRFARTVSIGLSILLGILGLGYIGVVNIP